MKILVFATFLVSSERIGAFTCTDNRGEPVPWFTAYKLPELKNGSVPIAEGEALLYIDPAHSEWTSARVEVDRNGHHVERTLEQVYGAIEGEHFKLLYNDEHPNGTYSETSGHTKGVVLFNSTVGFWLIHSVPRFPPTDSYAYPSTGHRYGQSFFCVSFKTDQLRSIAKQLLYIESYIYDSKLTAKMARKFPDLTHVIEGKGIEAAPYSRAALLTGVDGTLFTHFSKAGKFGKDLYANLVSPSLRVSLDVEAWRNGVGNLPPSCANRYKVYDVHRVAFAKREGLWFWNSHDHSKWAASRNASKPWICIGDINRQKHQLVRGGGTMCKLDKSLWQSYHNLVTKTDTC